jgi:hypothetical protein
MELAIRVTHDEKKWIKKKRTVRSNKGRLIFYNPNSIFVCIIVLLSRSIYYSIVFGRKKADEK